MEIIETHVKRIAVNPAGIQDLKGDGRSYNRYYQYFEQGFHHAVTLFILYTNARVTTTTVTSQPRVPRRTYFQQGTTVHVHANEGMILYSLPPVQFHRVTLAFYRAQVSIEYCILTNLLYYNTTTRSQHIYHTVVYNVISLIQLSVYS